MRYSTLTLLVFSLAACKDKGGDDTASADDSGTGVVDDGETPSITTADAWCYLHDTGDPVITWSIKATASDPQGEDTLESFVTDAIIVKSGDTVVTTQAMVCDTTGSCSGAFSEDASGVACSAATSYTFVLAVEDEDDHRSTDYELEGREGTDSEG